MNLDRQRILEAMATIGTANPGDPRLFLAPRSLKRILNPATVVVLGARGSGKSELAAHLTQSIETPGAFQKFLKDKPYPFHCFDAFSQRGPVHPEASVLDSFIQHGDDERLRHFWVSTTFLQFSRKIAEIVPEVESIFPDIFEVMKHTGGDPRRMIQVFPAAFCLSSLDSFERHLLEELKNQSIPLLYGYPLLAVYDDLDTVGAFDFELRRRFIRALLVLWTTLSTRYKHLRAKIFLPSDLFDLRLFDAPDASKLMARAERLEWDTLSLYRLVLRHLGAQGEDLRAWLGTFGLRFQEEGESGWVPEEPSEESLKRWLTETLRAVVAVSGTRSAVQQWIPNRLRDGKDQVAPRSMLGFFRESARIALSRPPRASWGRLLSVEDAVGALSRVGEFRIGEIREVYPWVDRMEALRGRVLPLPREQVEALLGRDPARRVRETAPREGHLVTADLVRLGLLRELEGGDRIDVPDLFVSTFGILRGAEVPPSQATSR